MYRDKIEELKKWKQSSGRKPLIIRGARQVGKTWLAKAFGAEEYKNIAYVFFYQNRRMKELFANSPDMKEIITGLRAETGVDIDPENTLIIFDEIQEVPEAIASLKYIYETAPEYHIIATGSLLGVAIHSGVSFPVGKVDYLDLRPLSYTEFLKAMDEQKLVELLDDADWKMMGIFRDKFIDYLKQYYIIGGMPEVVKNYVENHSFIEARKLQKKILVDYSLDFGKHIPANIIPRLHQVWESIPHQLAKENNKFIYSLLREGARAKEYEQALWWLEDAGLITIVKRVETPKLPLTAYLNEPPVFKIFLVDTGLLSAMGDISEKTILEKNDLFEEFKGSLTEQYVLGELLNVPDVQIYYWSRDAAKAELDFLVQLDDEIIPIEVKAEENLQAKSLKSYIEKYSPNLAVRTSMSNYREEATMTNLPLYAVSKLPLLLEASLGA
jgi:predicted AAA+ superfamily ATPase